MKRHTTTNKTHTLTSTTLSFLRRIAPAVVVALAAGCGEAGAPEEKVDVPEIEGAVAAADFCALVDEITCAGAVGCCSNSEIATVEECIQMSSCTNGLGSVLESEAAQSGEVVYDAVKAGDYLRSLADVVAACDHHPDALSRPTFLYGTRAEGEDCTPDGSDLSSTFTCAPGLECAVVLDKTTQTTKGTCATPAAAAAAGGAGAACATGEDCASGSCSEGACAADFESEYCLTPKDTTPPANADPTHLYIDLAGDNSGSSGDVTLTYSSDNKFWRCTITSTLSDGQEKVCAVTSSGTATGDSGKFFDIEMAGNDGLRVDTVCACSDADISTNKCTTDVECFGTFNDYGSKADWCSDSSWNTWLWANACSKIWLDGDSHGKCNHFEVDGSDDNFTTCED
jgi:hypothetical protein